MTGKSPEALRRKLCLEVRLAARRAMKRKDGNGFAGLRWGVVGPGGMAEEFAAAIAREGTGRVEAVSSRSRKRAESFGKRHAATSAYQDLSAMLENERRKLDIVYIATPAATHYELVAQCLEAGYNVLCEKPLVHSASQAEYLFSLASERGLRLFEGMWMRCLPTYNQAHAWLESGEIGALQGVRAAILKAAPGKEVSVLMDYGAYALSFMADLVAEGPATLSVIRQDDTDGVDRDWFIRAIDSTGTNFEVELSNRRTGNSDAQLRGDGGMIEIPAQFNRADRVMLKSTSGSVRDVRKHRYISSGFEYELDEINRTLLNGESSNLTPDKTLRATVLMEHLLSAPPGPSEVTLEF